MTFANSWFRYLQGQEETEVVETDEVKAAEKAVREETGDDREAESRTAHAAIVQFSEREFSLAFAV